MKIFLKSPRGKVMNKISIIGHLFDSVLVEAWKERWYYLGCYNHYECG